MSIHHCIRIVDEEGPEVEVATEGSVPEATPSSGTYTTNPESALFAIQGKPRCM